MTTRYLAKIMFKIAIFSAKLANFPSYVSPARKLLYLQEGRIVHRSGLNNENNKNLNTKIKKKKRKSKI